MAGTGIPFGAKDVFETKGLATEYGSPVYKGRIGAYDAAIVRDLRERGAILLGKTQTAAFHWLDSTLDDGWKGRGRRQEFDQCSGRFWLSPEVRSYV